MYIGSSPSLTPIEASQLLEQGKNLFPRLDGVNAGPLGYRNKIINGNFAITPRINGITAVSATNTYQIDRWIIRGTSLTGGSQTIQSVKTVDRASWPSGYYAALVRTGLTTASYFHQRVEDVGTLAGKRVTLSFRAAPDADETVTVQVNQHFGSGGSADVGAATIAVPVKGGVTATYSVTFDMPSIQGKTVGAGDHIAVFFHLSGLSGTFRLSDVQLEEGAYATLFEQRLLGVELALCQRYYQKIELGTFRWIAAAANATSYVPFNFPSMRVQPSLATVTAATVTNGTIAGPTIVSDSSGFFGSTSAAGGSVVMYGLVIALTAEL